MAAPKAIENYGPFSVPLLTAESYTRRYDGLDSGRFTIINDSADTYPANNTYNGFTILEDDVQRIGENWEHNLSCVGIRGSKPSRKFKRVVNRALEGFDTASETWITSNPNSVKPGDRLSGYASMICESAPIEDLEHIGWYRINASFRGIAGTKPVKRTISANVDISVVDNLVLVGGGGDASNAHRWAIAWPKVTVTFSYVANSTQLKMMPEQGGSPAGTLPTIQLALTELPTSDSMTWNWPNGWRLVAMPMDPIAGTDIALIQEVWEWQQKVTL